MYERAVEAREKLEDATDRLNEELKRAEEILAREVGTGFKERVKMEDGLHLVYDKGAIFVETFSRPVRGRGVSRCVALRS